MPKSTVEVVGILVSELEPFTQEDRGKIVQAVFALLGQPQMSASGAAKADNSAGSEVAADLPVKAQIWTKQNNINADQIDQVFHREGSDVNIIAAEIPGKTNRDKVRNAYILCGVASFISSGEPKFDDKAARGLCESSGFYDHTNHSKYLKGGNEFTGSKAAGWTLTAPGLKKGATLIHEIGKAS